MAIEQPANVPNMPSDADMFRQSTADAPPAPPMPEPPPVPSQAPPSPPLQGYSDDPQPSQMQPPLRVPVRDEHGRFTGQFQEGEDDKTPPSYRFKEMREERDALARENRQWELAYHEIMQRQRAAEAQQQEALKRQQPQAVPDPVLDPQGWNSYVNNMLAERDRRIEQNVSFRMAHERHGDLFQHAYTEMLTRAHRGDPSVVQHVMSTPDPGASMMKWYRDEYNSQVLGGNDPDTWAREIWFRKNLQDPRFVGWAYEQMRGVTQNGGQGYAPSPQYYQPAPYQQYGSPPVQLPPSLSSIPAAAPVTATNGDMSDASLFDFAMRQGRPRR